MKWNRLATTTAAAAVSALLFSSLPPAAQAGCGCDHPPPAFAQLMPPFGSPGRSVRIHADTGAFSIGEAYRVRIANRSLSVIAQSDRYLEIQVPADANPGPTSVAVDGPGYVETYPEDAFTVLPAARAIPQQPGVFSVHNLDLAISATGTILVPVDVSAVLDPTQFAFAFLDSPVTFGHDEVVIYNADGVDLTLFTLAVDDPTKRQWGRYYGWSVEQDAGLTGVVFDHLVEPSLRVDRTSDLFSYWRHEFHTYADAHAPGGSHEIDSNGLHPDGSRHVDHDRLVIAISGRLRDRKDPLVTRPLRPGVDGVDLAWISLQTPGPLDPSGLLPMLDSGLDGAAELAVAQAN